MKASTLASAFALSSLFAGAGCGPGGTTTGSSGGGSAGAAGTTNTTPTGGDGGSIGGVGGTLGGDHGKLTALAISPDPGLIEAQNGKPASMAFVAKGTFEDGYSGPVTASWTWDRPTVALVDGAGTLNASGKMGGAGTLTASFGGMNATAPVTVKLTFSDNSAALTPDQQTLFDTPSGSPSGTLLYPYDATVFARGLVAPELMWSGGAAGDAYLVHIKEQFMEAKLYVVADPPSDVKLAQDLWTSLTESNAGEDVEVDVQRLSGGQAYTSMHETWKIAQGSLRGSIYYWAVNTGQLMKIAPGASSPTVVFDSGPADQLNTPAPANYDGSMPPWESGGNNKRCVACHTVSKDGSTIAAVFERKGSTASPWGTIDLTQSPASVTQITPYNSSAIYLGISPDGKYVVENDVSMKMRLADAKAGSLIPSALDSFADSTCDPAFSHDGKMLAFSGNVNGFYPVEFYRADLDVMDFDEATATFANRRTVVPGGNLAVAFPSFSPDSQWLLYQYGDYSRARYGAAGDQTGNNDLYIADTAGMAGPAALDAASGAGLEPKNQHKSYQPTVNPIAVGGYFWVVFVSPRDYGNRMVSGANPTTDNRKQLWVAAVDVNPVPGKDPSHPAFWLPGQDLSTINMSGYWALEPCHQEGQGCSEGFECCTGFCQPDGMGQYSCVPPPGGCSKQGDACTTDGDCCNSPTYKCIGGFCAQAVPG